MNILVVEDDIDLLEAISDLLRAEGHIVESATSGNAAKELILRNLRFHLVVSDYYMPEGNGRELLEFIRDRDPLVPAFLMLTGHASASEEEIKALGAQEFITKPFDVAFFLRTARKYESWPPAK